MKTFKIVSIIGFIGFATISCSPERAAIVQGKSGVQLWSETCMRCHNTPSPADFNDADWSTIEMHMRVRANLTADESKKIFDFLRSAN
ncbi:cytochrome c [Lutibacter sp. B1]|uniref:cytochrome c n=1 Tax=Lutibacter sp. B1 TaxID=2725996 RepID=UPI0014579529|nr:cytochrome c [Lutibacter sp. B1]NLP59019.1 cytochrome c [Lutibacter sp. B1]